MFTSRARWLLLLQLLVQEKLVTSRSTLSPDIDIEAILDMSPRTTTIDYDLADFDEQANGPSYATDTAESTPAPSGNDTGGDTGKSKTVVGAVPNNNGKVVMLGPDSNDNVDGLVLSDVQYDNPGSSEDNVATEAAVGTVMSGFGGSVNPDPDYDGDGTSTGDISGLNGAGSTSDITRDTGGSVSDSTETSDSIKPDRVPSSNGVTSGQGSVGPSFSSCFNTSGSTQTDFCRFVNAVYDVCNAHFSSECSSSSDSSSTDQSGVTAEEESVSKETVESGSNMSEESMDTESAVLSPDSSSFDNLAASLESMNSAEMSEKTMNEILKIVKGLCPSVCSAASKQDSSESGSTSSESSVESAESSAHSSMTEETYSETSEERNSPETINESDSGSSDSSNTVTDHTSSTAAEPKPLESSNINMAAVQSDSDTETESDSEY